jgi:hypothetical protein
MADGTHEVRRCSKCRQPSVLMSAMSRDESTGLITRDFCCQSCGHEFTLHPPLYGWTLIGLGLIMACGVLPLAFVVLGIVQLRTGARNPVVVGAAMPERRFPGGPRARRCPSCGSTVPPEAHHRGRWQSVTTHYLCGECGHFFVIQNRYAHAYGLFLALICALATGAILDEARTPVVRFGGAAFTATLAVALVARVILRAANQSRSPTV